MSTNQIQRFKQNLLVARKRLERALNVYESARDQFEFDDAMELGDDELFDVFELVTNTFDQLRKQVQQLQTLDLQWRRFIQNMPENTRADETTDHELFIRNFHEIEQNGEQTVANMQRILPGLRAAAAVKLGIDPTDYDATSEGTLHKIPSSVFAPSRPPTPTMPAQQLGLQANPLQADQLQANLLDLQPTQYVEPQPNVVPSGNQSLMLNGTDLLYLPKVKIPDFDGDASSWIDFWDLFAAMVHHRNLEPCVKLFLLRTHLKGDAALALAKVGNANADYEIAIRILKELFGDPKQVQHRLRAQIIHYSVPENNPTALYRCWAHLSQLYSQLISSGDVVDNTLMGQILESKFPRYVIQKIHRPGISAPTSAQGILTAIGTILKTEANIDQLIGDNKATFKSHKKQPSIPQKPKQWNLTHASIDVKNNDPIECSLCDGAHWTYKCPNYDKPSMRFARAKERRLCFNCLSSEHNRRQCRSDKRCKHCDRHHHSSLCLNSDGNDLPAKESLSKTKKVTFKRGDSKPKWQPNANLTKLGPNRRLQTTAMISDQMHEDHLMPKYGSNRHEQTTAIINDQVYLSVTSTIHETTTLLMTVETMVQNRKQSKLSTKVPIFIDAGSTKTYISNDLVKKLKLRPISEEKLTINTFGNQTITDDHAKLYEVLLMTDGPFKSRPIELQAIGRPELTMDILMANEAEISNPALSAVPVKPQILVGMDSLDRLMIKEEIISLPSGFKLRQSPIGSIICGVGKAKIVSSNSTTKNYYTYSNDHQTINHDHGNVNQEDEDPLGSQMRQFWSIEHLGILDDPDANDDELALRSFNATIEKDENGRYSCGWPWKAPNPKLPTNFPRAMGCLQSTLRRLQSQRKLFEKYDATFREQLAQDMIEEVSRKLVDGQIVHYIPHHPVVTQKLRIVFNASAKTSNGKSLNDLLYRGPVVLPELLGILLRFRVAPIPLLGDLEKAFLQVGLRLQDRDCTRFLWIRDIKKPCSPENLVIYRYKRIPFGVVSSPFLLAATVNHHLHNYPHPLSQSILPNIFVDNVFMACKSIDEAINAYHTSKEIFASGYMNLRDFVTCDSTVKQYLIDQGYQIPEKAKVLGLQWLTESDELLLNTIPKCKENGTLSKREVLSQISSIFDPIGFVSPLLIGAKIFMQELWSTGQKWDDSLTGKEEIEWNAIKQELINVSPLYIPRRVNINEDQPYHLHIFADASKDAYATVAYLQSELLEDPVFIMGKTRVAPLKRLSIPRMELLAATIAAKLATTIQSELSQIQIRSTTIWSDSMIVLAWLRTTKILPTFVKNRVLNIWQKVPKATFKYVPTDVNPADCATRASNFQSFKESLWLSGPLWLKNSHEWPTQPDLKNYQLEVDESEKIDGFDMTASVFARTTKEPIIDATRFSSWPRLVRTMMKVMKFIAICTDRSEHWHKNYGESPTYERAEGMVFRQAQLSDPPKKDTIRNLNLYPDEEHLLICHTRLTHSNLHASSISPVYLPPDSHFTHLYVLIGHLFLNHAPKATLICALRVRVWIPKIRVVVNKVIRKWCLTCRNPKPFRLPDFPSLPDSRVLKQRPFESTGLDYAGPMTIRITKKQQTKMWICLFCCLTSRAIHLEPIYDLTTVSFIQAFRRFVSRRGAPSNLHSDNASTFKSASKVLQEAWLQHEDVQFYLTTRGIKWSNIVQAAPWQGGSWERLIGITKVSIRRMIGQKILSLPEMITVLTEVEALVNSRPLTYVPSGEFGEVIRPIDCISPGIQIGVPILESYDSDEPYNPKPSPTDKLIRLWQRQQQLLDNFWSSWKNQYLTSLYERPGTAHKQDRSAVGRLPEEGEVVVLPVGERKRGEWKLAKVLKVLKPTRIRLQLISGKNDRKVVIERSPKAFCPLEISSPMEDEPTNNHQEVESESEDEVETTSRQQPARRSKTKAIKLLSQLQVLMIVTVMLCITPINAQVQLSSHLKQCEPTKFNCLPNGCCDLNENCQFWAKAGECEANSKWMIPNCRLSCSACSIPSDTPVPEGSCPPHQCAPWKLECCTYSQKSGMLLWFVIILLVGPSLLTITFCLWKIIKLLLRSIRSIYRLICRQPEQERDVEDKTQKRKRQFRRLSSFISIILLMLPSIIDGCSEITQLSTQGVRCQIDPSTRIKTCKIEQSVSIAIHPVGETACISVTSMDNEELGQLEVTTRAIKYKCNYQFWYFTRDYLVRVSSVHRCRQASGSQCFDDFCETVTDNTVLKDLPLYERQQPGYSKCARSCQCATCDNCFLCEPSCLFYRIYAEKANDYLYEVGACPTWTVSVITDIKWIANNTTLSASAILFPADRVKFLNSTFTLQSATVPPLPILNKAFAHRLDSKEAMILDASPPNQPTANAFGGMQCQSKEQARNFQCSFPLSICTCSHDYFSAKCNCGYANFGGYIDEKEYALPLQTGPVTVEKDRSATVNQHAGLQLQVDFHNVTVELVEYSINCSVTAEEQVTGCRSCQTGATAKVKCEAIVPTTISILCSDANQTYIYACDNSTHSMIIHSEVEQYTVNCSYQCSQSTGHFALHGTLETITPRNSVDPETGDWWSRPAAVGDPFNNIMDAIIDFAGEILKFTLHNPILVLFIVIVVILVVTMIVWLIRLYLLPKTLAMRNIVSARRSRVSRNKTKTV